MKRLLVSAGIILILIGLLMVLQPEPETKKVLWEKIPNEEIHTYIAEERAGENLPEYETDSCTEEADQEPGSDSSSECSTDAEYDSEEGEINSFSYDEAQLLMKVAQAEAGNQGEDGIFLVMSVIVNRMKTEGSEYHPEGDHTVQGTVFKKYSFSSVWDGRYLEMEPTAEVHRALARIERGEVAKEIIGFEVKSSRELDKYFDEAFEYKDHRFYTRKAKEE